MAELSASPGSLAFESYVDALGEEADRLGLAASRSPDASVPTCPGWTATDLVDHVVKVYRVFVAQLDARDPTVRTEPVGDSPRGDGDLRARLEHAATSLHHALESAGTDSPCFNPSGRDLVSGWVARRMALETAVHRVDAQLALGRAEPVETELAVDGIDEQIASRLSTRVGAHPEAALGGTLCLVCDDADAAWVVEVGGGRLRWRQGRGPADVVLVGHASQLLLFTWNRQPLAELHVTGRSEVALAWSTLPL